jgi:hypothetical protein
MEQEKRGLLFLLITFQNNSSNFLAQNKIFKLCQFGNKSLDFLEKCYAFKIMVKML